MKIVLDTVSKQTICPSDFFDNIRKINDASELTGSEKVVTPENYLEKIINECTKVIINKSETTKRRRTSRTSRQIGNKVGDKIGEIVVNPIKN